MRAWVLLSTPSWAGQCQSRLPNSAWARAVLEQEADYLPPKSGRWDGSGGRVHTEARGRKGDLDTQGPQAKGGQGVGGREPSEVQRQVGRCGGRKEEARNSGPHTAGSWEAMEETLKQARWMGKLEGKPMEASA